MRRRGRAGDFGEVVDPASLMHELLQQIFSGLAAGVIYASLALALVMIYRATELVNFAQGPLRLVSGT
jgi:branched-subunit amino acid ABC-type transport system permease component